MTGEIQHFVNGKRAGEKADPAWGVVRCGFRSASQHENGNLGKAGMELGDELGTADSGHLEAGYDEAEIVGEERLFNEAEGLGRIAHALHVLESPFEEGHTEERLEWIVVHQQDCGHGVLNSARALARPSCI